MPLLKTKVIQRYDKYWRVYSVDDQWLRYQQEKYDRPITTILEHVSDDKIILTTEKPPVNKYGITKSEINENIQKHCNRPLWLTEYCQLALIRRMGLAEDTIEIPKQWIVVQYSKYGKEVTEVYEEIHTDYIVLTPVKPRLYRKKTDFADP